MNAEHSIACGVFTNDDGLCTCKEDSTTAYTEKRLRVIEAQARRVIASIEGAKIAGGVDLWIALWDLRALLLHIDSDEFDLPRPGGIS